MTKKSFYGFLVLNRFLIKLFTLHTSLDSSRHHGYKGVLQYRLTKECFSTGALFMKRSKLVPTVKTVVDYF